MRLLWMVLSWLFPPCPVDPAFVVQADRARLERLAGQTLGPAVPVRRDPADIPAGFVNDDEIERRFQALVAGLQHPGQMGRDL